MVYHKAYIGLIPFEEFLKIVADEDKNLLNVFEDNVRDFQGEDNDVNGGIAKTIDNEGSEIFSVLNNANANCIKFNSCLQETSLQLLDYQIVNGCQTSNVLYNYKDSEHIARVHIPINLFQLRTEAKNKYYTS